MMAGPLEYESGGHRDIKGKKKERRGFYSHNCLFFSSSSLMGISAKKQKTIRKTVHSYCVGFGFRPPYQVLLDGEFCRAALEKQVYVKDAIPDLLGGLTRIGMFKYILTS